MKTESVNEPTILGMVYWRNLLENRKNQVMESEERLTEEAFSNFSGYAVGELSNLRLHPADLATENQRVETLNTRSLANIQRLQEIEEAIDRTFSGSYGYCTHCGEPIPIKRLQIIPETRFCAECAV